MKGKFHTFLEINYVCVIRGKKKKKSIYFIENMIYYVV